MAENGVTQAYGPGAGEARIVARRGEACESGPRGSGEEGRAVEGCAPTAIRRALRATAALFIGVALVGCGAAFERTGGADGGVAVERSGSVSPEATAGGVYAPWGYGKSGVADLAMIASAHPLATDAGLEVLRAGGNAVDAAVAAGFAIGVVEPMMSGIGGGGAMLIWNEALGRADHVDFYATAPANPDMELRNYRGNRATPRAVAVPGLVAGLLDTHERYGRLSRAEVLAPAIRLAAEGFRVHALLARTIEADSAKLAMYPESRRLFWPDGRPLRAGEVLVQPALAHTLRRIAEDGRDGFYKGEVAREIVEVVRAGGNPMTEADLAAVRPRWQRPVCADYRGYQVVTAAPPQSGIQVVQTLKLLEPHDIAAMGPPTRSLESFNVLVSAMRTAIADRTAYIGDPAHNRMPVAQMASDPYAAARAVRPDGVPEIRRPAGHPGTYAPVYDDGCAALDPFGLADAQARDGTGAGGRIDRTAHRGPSVTWTNAGDADSNRGVGADGGRAEIAQAEEESDLGETTHLSVVDAEGNAVSLTITQGLYFGSGAFAAGTFLNSAMFLFTNDADHPNTLGPNRVPRSTTTPTILLRDGRVEMVVGSPGAGRIPPAVIQSIIYAVDYGLEPMQALSMPRLNPFFSSLVVEFEQGVAGSVLEGAADLGYQLRAYAPTSLHFGGVHMIQRRDGRWVGAADPRRDGSVAGY